MCFHFYRVKHFISSKQILQIDICKRHLDFFKVNCLLSPSSACRFVCFPVTDLDNQRIKKNVSYFSSHWNTLSLGDTLFLRKYLLNLKHRFKWTSKKNQNYRVTLARGSCKTKLFHLKTKCTILVFVLVFGHVQLINRLRSSAKAQLYFWNV